MALVAVLAWLLAAVTGLGASLLAIAVGAILGNTVGPPGGDDAGARTWTLRLLLLAVALLGFRVHLEDLVAVGREAWLVPVGFAVAAGAAWVVGRAVRAAPGLSILLGIGTAVCGASAIAAAAPMLRARPQDAAYAITTVSLLGTLGMFVYPVLGLLLPFADQAAYGSWAGLTLHAVPQAIVAGFALGPEAGDSALAWKLARVAALPLVLLALSLGRRTPIPKEVALFVVAAVVANAGLLSEAWTTLFQQAAQWVLLAALAGIGLQTRVRDLAAAGWRPLAVGVASWVAMAGAVLALLML